MMVKSGLEEIFLEFLHALAIFNYCKLVSSNTSYLEAHSGVFRLLMKGIFDKKLERRNFEKVLIQ